MTVVSVESSTSSTALVLPFEVASARAARRRLAADLRAAGIASDEVHDAVLVLSELVGNALRHARPLPAGALRVTWRRHPHRLEVSVTDGGGPTEPRPLELPASALGGRGLAIVDDLSARWGVRRGDRTTTVYAVLDLTPGTSRT
ncbi:ATP-binding protein [Actinopolymorpha rutila]|uniref:Anti-sigma regulatory factor (Ser/Thr protein kinase) n=1 Tax=Actinopolymorpha rutila TaxID=446787 RepID=A0A852Z637_9ACTN|nr:anti-sigma regulatory factor (Ser/Thr protein kinase) [Actinopolymorpha rutila]